MKSELLKFFISIPGIRNMFAYDEDDANDAIPMNTANFAPTFNNVQLLMNDYHLELNKNISIQNRVNELSLVIDSARELIAAQLGVTSQEIALMRNGTEANNNINNGQILHSTDEVLLWHVWKEEKLPWDNGTR